jgi:hypothetical protein
MTNEEIAQLLREFGSAIRGDWGSIDGRSIRHNMDRLADLIEVSDSDELRELSAQRSSEKRGSALLQVGRDYLNICPAGKGHWPDYCDEECAS